MNGPKNPNDAPLKLTLNIKGAAAVFACPTPTLRALVIAGGIDPKRDFRGADLRGWPLAGQDVRGFNFTKADLRGTGIELAIYDETTVFDGSLQDGIDEPLAHLPPPNGYLDMVREMIIAGETPPADWVPYIQELDFRRTKLTDITPLADLTALQTLYLSDTQISNIEGLGNLIKLQSLYLSRTKVSDISALRKLTMLKTLSLWDTEVSNIEPLVNLTKLQSLNLINTRVSDLAPLAGHKSLKNLDLRGTDVNNIAPLAALTSLKSLGLADTTVSDIALLSSITGLRVFVEPEQKSVELQATLAAGSQVDVYPI